jgi:hypothetical protein
MSIQDLGAIGELIGAVAVIVTLVYLAIQTRQSRIAVEQTAKFAGLQATNSAMDNYTQWRALLLSDSRFSALLVKANNGSDLTEEQRIQLSAIFDELFLAGAFSYLSSHTSGSLHPTTADVDYLTSYLGENPSGLREWQRMRFTVEKISPEFAVAMDRSLEEIENAA